MVTPSGDLGFRRISDSAPDRLTEVTLGIEFRFRQRNGLQVCVCVRKSWKRAFESVSSPRRSDMDFQRFLAPNLKYPSVTSDLVNRSNGFVRIVG